ncbi:MAG: hypothetical protein PHQ74_13725, partial [Crocinitomicaceae bacterium]|nr:hypothetical protein [Crocinitomicaceae bacterium]
MISRDEVPVDEGVLTEFKVNGIEYKSFFEKQNDGSWKFQGYRDKDNNIYDNFDKAESTTGDSATDGNSAEGSINNSDTTTETPSSSDNSGASQDGNRDLENTIDNGGKGAGFINIFGSLIELNALAAKYETVQYAQIIPKANNPNRVISAKGLEKYYSKFFTKLAKFA